jgi:mono/diheme cytochrome c family protein
MRRVSVAAGGLFVLMCAAGVALSGQAPAHGGGNPEAAKLMNPVPASAESIAAGATLFRRRCSGCHGADAKGGPPKEDFLPPGSNLVDETWDHGATDGEIFTIIKNGVPPELVMEAWGERISETDIWNVVNYLRDAGKKK